MGHYIDRQKAALYKYQLVTGPDREILGPNRSDDTVFGELGLRVLGSNIAYPPLNIKA